MLKVVSTSVVSGDDVIDDVVLMHPPVYILHCKDSADNEFEIETNKDTYVQVTDFLDKIRSI